MLADHIIKRRIRFQIIHLDDGGRLTGGEQCGTVIQQLNGIAVQPIPTILAFESDSSVPACVVEAL